VSLRKENFTIFSCFCRLYFLIPAPEILLIGPEICERMLIPGEMGDDNY
jgi:hypothetical protein